MIFRRLTGVGIQDSDPRLKEMVAAIDEGHPERAAKAAKSDSRFYNVLLRNWASPWSSVAVTTLSPFDDIQASAVGLVRDSLDFRLLLTDSNQHGL